MHLRDPADDREHKLEPIQEHFTEEDMDDTPPPAPQRPVTRHAARLAQQQAQPPTPEQRQQARGPDPEPQPQPQQPQSPQAPQNDGEHRNRHKCPACQTLLKLWNGTRTCPCGHDGRNKQLLTDQANQQLWVHDLDNDERMGQVAYARGLVNHPDYFTVPALAATVHAARNCGVLLSPSITSSSEDEGTADYDDNTPLHGFSPEADLSEDPSSSNEDEPDTSGARYRRCSSTRYDMLGETTQEPPQLSPGTEHGTTQSPQPGTSNPRPDGFAALLAASREAANKARQPTNSPGPSTQEAPPTQPKTPAAPPHPDSSTEDTTTSPLHTRSGQIRGPPPGPKKRQPRAK